MRWFDGYRWTDQTRTR
ncbi:hypothetical protein GLP40_12070 [Nocardia sp. CT2-14]|uniref:Uncharacterized protein n=1 Tax=Nocardia aurantiaca TaxID=2675850 RepID=A0A6I3KXB0_9NOCA|nr:hypothetical protein [Nocardia aurantiaca]